MRKAALLLLPLLLPCVAFAKTHRDPAQRAAFVRKHPCPATGRNRGACPGYVVDHVRPLCAGGPDRPANMQWQSIAQAKAKDRDERRTCAALRKEAKMHERSGRQPAGR